VARVFDQFERTQSAGGDVEAPLSTPTLHLAVLDADRGFGNLLNIPTRELDWRITKLSELPPADTLAVMQLDVLLVDIDTIEADVTWLSRQAMELPKVTILAYSETSTVTQRVRGLQAGLDGWISRACDPYEVLARIQAIVRARRGQRVAARPPIYSGDMLVDLTRYDAIAGGRSAGMTTREFEVFALLVESAGKALSREDIYAGVWGSDTPEGDRSVDIFVSRIRLKLRRLSPNWSYLHTHVGVGYRFEAERNLTSDSSRVDGFAVSDTDPIAA
jgi:DNA-binding response OmpR family regulator